jgi:alkanesulfonate monooxygenase SsuD/methylene tetrahydromethanopterin reductase-like flavin-dependent oxidoreductase (luciferase family)
MSRTVAMRAPRDPNNKTPRQPGVAILPPRGERTQIQPAVAAGERGRDFAAELATFAAAMSKSPGEVLKSLSADLAAHADRRAAELQAMSSADRRSSVAAAFAPPKDAASRLRAVVTEVGPLLRAEIYSQLPPWLRSEVRDLVRTEAKPPVPPLVTRLAARLIREATR